MSKKLNIGCGSDIRKGWVNLDSAKLPGVDVVHDINILPLPFADNEFDEILCQDILEHVEYIPVLREIWRMLRSGGFVTIRVPHFTSRNNFIDPTHKKMFSVRTFDFFSKSSLKNRNYYFDFAFSSIEKISISFEKGRWFYWPNKIMEYFVNKSRQRQDFYESTFLSRLFPAQNIIFTIKK
jgi:ubiquinone/menaquinone biosynthesis C-methylase UbiE